VTVLSAFLESLLNILFNKLKKCMKSFTINVMAITPPKGVEDRKKNYKNGRPGNIDWKLNDRHGTDS